MARPPRDRVLALAMALFFVGLLTIGAAFLLFADDRRTVLALIGVSSVLVPLALVLGVGRTAVLARRRAAPPASPGDADPGAGAAASAGD